MSMDDILLRQAPHSVEAEQAVLGSILIDGRCFNGVVGVIKAEDFYSAANSDIFRTLYSMFSFGLPIDPVTVLDRMREDGVWNDDSPGYIRDLMMVTPTAANVMEYAAIVRDKALLRGLADAGADINGMAISGEGGAENILEAAERRIYDLRQGRERVGLEPISQILVGVYEQITNAMNSGGKIPGLATGIYDLDRMILGLSNSDLIFIASRPGMGKTSIALNIALHVAKTSGKTVAVFSLEMSREQLAMRLLSAEAYIDGKKLQRGQIKPDEWERLVKAASIISKADLLINDDATLTVSEMLAQCRRLQNLGLVVIDYLQLMQAATSNDKQNQFENRATVVSKMSRMMKIMAKDLNVPVVCLSQLNRDNEKRKESKKPRLSDLRESGSIEQDADIVLGLYRDIYYNEESETPNLAECLILKNRRGDTGTIELQWLPEYTTFTSLDRKHEE